VGVPHEPVALEPDDLEQLGVDLEVDRTVHHVHADLLQLPGPEDVVGLVELGPELHQHGHVLAVLPGAHQRLHDGGVLADPVQAYLDALDVGVLGGLVHEPDDGPERLVGVVEDPILGLDGVEEVHALRKLRRRVGLEGLVLQLGVVQAHDLPEVLREDGLRPVDLELVQAQVAAEDLDHVVGHLGLHDHPDREPDVPVLQGLLHGGHEVAGLVDGDLDVGVAGDPEAVCAVHGEAGEQRGDVVLYDVLDEHVHLLPLDLRGDLDEPGEHPYGDLDPGVHVLVPALQLHCYVQGVVRDERERVGDVQPQRGEQRVDPLPVELGDPCLLVRVEVQVPLDVDALVGQLGAEDRPAVAVLLQEPLDGLGHPLHQGVVVDRGVVRTGDGRALDYPGDADHEELVHVGVADGQELDPLEQRVALVEGLLEASPVELQPGQLPVDVVALVVEVRAGGRGLLTPHRNHPPS